MYSHSKIWIDYIPNIQARFDGGDLLFDRELRTGDPWNGASTSGFVTIELADGHTQLTKPLIVVEGFDPNDDFNYFSLINGTRNGGLQVDIDPNPTSFQSLNDAIEDQNYDLVFVDYQNGTDFIQRNALMVEDVIEWVNGLKANNPNAEPNVVMGLSMGGLVARYALRHMEMTNLVHDTELYISHDTPHQGANAPLGFQAMVRHLKGETIKLPIFF
ncbi:esterase/lipase family protein [Polaribacter sp. M15]